MMMMMMKPGNQSEGVRDSAALVSSNSAMDLKASRLMQCASVYQSIGEVKISNLSFGLLGI